MAKAKKAKAVNPLLSAIKFVALGCSKSDSETDTHCILGNCTAVVNNGVIALGHVIAEDISACPQTAPLILALERCGDQYAVVQQAASLSVRSDDFQAHIPCCDPSRLTTATPDAPVMAVGDALTAAFALAMPLASEKAEYLLNAVIQVRNSSVIATNNEVLIQAWHGFDLPSMLLPKAAVTAIVKCKRALTGFGYSGDTATFWFGTEAWIRTKVFKERIPDVLSMLNTQVDLISIPEGLFAATKRIAPFSEDGRVVVTNTEIRSHVKMAQGGRTETLQSSLQPHTYSIKSFKFVESFATRMDERAHEKATFFYGSSARAAVWHGDVPQPCSTPGCTGCDVCIPF